MANIRNSNTFFVDTAASDTQASTAGNLVVPNIRVKHITVVSTSANATLSLSDVTTGDKKLEIRLHTSHDTVSIDYEDAKILFPNGISPDTVTHAKATIVVEESRG